MQDGRYILDASGWTLASARFPADARRIVAAINAVQGIPTDALESWTVNVIGEPIERVDAAGRAGQGDAPEPFPNEHRLSERRRGDRRASRPELRIFGGESSSRRDEEGNDRQ